jgi:hypothetical protein
VKKKKSDKPPKSVQKRTHQDTHRAILEKAQAILVKPASKHDVIPPVANFNEHDFIVFRQHQSGRSSKGDGNEYVVRPALSREE